MKKFLIIALFFLFPATTNACLTAGCHEEQTKNEYVHGPIAEGECLACHEAEDEAAAKHKKNPENFSDFTLAEGENGNLCLMCHEDIATEKVVHSPVSEGECTSCHNPHGGSVPFFLNEDSEPALCFSCHDNDKTDKAHVHTPVADGECTSCHAPHSAGQDSLLKEKPEELCVSCHEAIKELQNKETVHAPFEEGCDGCHDPHSSDTENQLLADSVQELCLQCHEENSPEIFEQITTAKFPHSPVKEGACTDCHSPHATDTKALLVETLPALCWQCHDTMQEKISAATHLHPPVEEGDCTGCHQVHGAQQEKLLIKPFSTSFYNKFGKGIYDLCFECHDSQLVSKEKVREDETNFRDGSRNLHYLHVIKRKKKGRSCRACHDVHGSTQPFMLHTEVPFRRGRWKLKLQYTLTDEGGTCVVGCHKPKTYSREQ